MKYTFNIFLLLLSSAIIITACTEIGPPINLTPSNGNLDGLISDSTYTETPTQVAVAKRIMIEEFSGQQCSNCPAGHHAIEQIVSTNAGKISSVTMHSVAFLPLSAPIPPVDFRNGFATTITNTYGNGSGIPCAMINRVLFSGQSTRAVLIPSQWGGLVSAELSKKSYVNINLKSFWNDLVAKDSIAVELHFNADASSDLLNFTLMITEDSIIGPQYLANGSTDTFYVHNNILRTMLTDASGTQIKGNKKAGNVKLLQFRTKEIDKNKWNINKLKLIAFVNKQNSGDYEIVQVAETKMK